MSDQEYISRVRAMERKLYRVAYALLWNDADCADAIQEAVFKGWMKRETLREQSFLETWLMRILINECKSMLRKSRRSTNLSEEAQDKLVNDEGALDPCQLLSLRQGLQELQEKYRMPLILHYLEGYSLKEIARTLGITPSLVKSRMHQARKLLKGVLKDEEE